MAQQTPLYEQHTLCGARMVDFHGWMMPLHYGSQIDEHHAVRTDAGMFDVSHMTIVDLRGSRTREFLRYLLANDVAKLTKSGKALYSGMLNASGGVKISSASLLTPPPAKKTSPGLPNTLNLSASKLLFVMTFP